MWILERLLSQAANLIYDGNTIKVCLFSSYICGFRFYVHCLILPSRNDFGNL